MRLYYNTGKRYAQVRITKLSKQTIYLDHAATSFPKAPKTGEAMRDYIESVGVNINRSTYAAATEASYVALETREMLCKLFDFADPTHVVFTPGQTYGLNTVIKGYLLPRGGHVLVSSLEHNAVMRPLTQLQDFGVTFERVPCCADGAFDMEAFTDLLNKKPALCIMTHASNVTGALLPMERIGRQCHDHGVPLLIDAAQTAGHVPLSFGACHASALSVPAHKGLLGPSGVGALLLDADFAKTLSPLVTGGTGSASDSELQPMYMPDRFESGTLNLPGIYGMHAALQYVLSVGVETFGREERALTARLIEGLSGLDGIRIVGPTALAQRVGVVSVDFCSIDNAEAAYRLENEFGILTRCGLHCAPNAHRVMGTFPQGTVRFSIGYKNTASDIDAALAAVAAISRGAE